MNYVMTKRDRALLIGLAGIVIFALTYYFVYTQYTQKTTDLNNANNALQSRVDVLQSISDQQGELLAETSVNNQMSEEIMNRFPAMVYEEDAIMLAIELEAYAPFESISSVDIDGSEQRYMFENINAMTDEVVNGYIPNSGNEPAPAEGENAEAQPVAAPADSPILYSRTIRINNLVDYDGLKNAIQYILDNDKRCSLQVSGAYNIETGLLQSEINVGKYYVTGTDKVYEAPEFKYVIQGTDNIFGTIPLAERKPINMERYDLETADSGSDTTEDAADE